MSEIFKAYDVRGIYPDEINEELMEKIGRAFADFIEGDNIAVGHDMRVSSDKLFNSFATDSGNATKRSLPNFVCLI